MKFQKFALIALTIPSFIHAASLQEAGETPDSRQVRSTVPTTLVGRDINALNSALTKVGLENPDAKYIVPAGTVIQANIAADHADESVDKRKINAVVARTTADALFEEASRLRNGATEADLAEAREAHRTAKTLADAALENEQLKKANVVTARDSVQTAIDEKTAADKKIAAIQAKVNAANIELQFAGVRASTIKLEMEKARAALGAAQKQLNDANTKITAENDVLRRAQETARLLKAAADSAASTTTSATGTAPATAIAESTTTHDAITALKSANTAVTAAEAEIKLAEQVKLNAEAALAAAQRLFVEKERSIPDAVQKEESARQTVQIATAELTTAQADAVAKAETLTRANSLLKTAQEEAAKAAATVRMEKEREHAAQVALADKEVLAAQASAKEKEAAEAKAKADRLERDAALASTVAAKEKDVLAGLQQLTEGVGGVLRDIAAGKPASPLARALGLSDAGTGTGQA